MSKLIRDISGKLEDWLALPSRSPLLIFGPRQVGKTTVARDFAARHFPDRLVEINFFRETREKNETAIKLSEIFSQTQDPRKVIEAISIYQGRAINPDQDLLFIDEIQDCKAAYEILKNFKDDFPRFPIIASGSYLGLFLEMEKEIRHPVGATTELNLAPLSFKEFLQNYNPPLYDQYLRIDIQSGAPMLGATHKQFLEALDLYFYTGGMPEVVANFLGLRKERPDLAAGSVRDKQKDLLAQYMRDVDKYAHYTSATKIRRIFEAIPLYLERYQEDPVQRIRFKEIDENFKSYRDLRTSFDYLKFNALIIPASVVNNPSFPLSIQRKENEATQFKAYLFDIGLLHCALDCPYNHLFNKNMGHYKGYLLENFVAQQLATRTGNRNLYSYKRHSRNQSAEIEFLVQTAGEIVPLEVKSSQKSVRSKSLDSYMSEFSPTQAYKCSTANLGKNKGYINLPVYLVEKIFDPKFGSNRI